MNIRDQRPRFATSTPEIEREARARLKRLRANTVRRCEAEAERGTGTGVCDAPLDEHGNCPRTHRHLEA